MYIRGWDSEWYGNRDKEERQEKAEFLLGSSTSSSCPIKKYDWWDNDDKQSNDYDDKIDMLEEKINELTSELKKAKTENVKLSNELNDKVNKVKKYEAIADLHKKMSEVSTDDMKEILREAELLRKRKKSLYHYSIIDIIDGYDESEEKIIAFGKSALESNDYISMFEIEQLMIKELKTRIDTNALRDKIIPYLKSQKLSESDIKDIDVLPKKIGEKVTEHKITKYILKNNRKYLSYIVNTMDLYSNKIDFYETSYDSENAIIFDDFREAIEIRDILYDNFGILLNIEDIVTINKTYEYF